MLPFAFVLQPHTATDQERIRIREGDRLKPDTMEVFPWTVTEFDTFLVDRTGISIGKVRYPLPVSWIIDGGNSVDLTTSGGLAFAVTGSCFDLVRGK